MPFADGGAKLRSATLHRAVVVVLFATSVCASPVRVATLGGDSRLLLDSTNLFDYPALVRQLAHADVELFDDWAGVALRVGERHGVGLFLNRPDEELDELSAYLAGTGSQLLRSLEPRPWLDAIYGLQLRPGLSLGAGLRYAYDVRDQGIDEGVVVGDLAASLGHASGVALGQQMLHQRLQHRRAGPRHFGHARSVRLDTPV
mgnify:CR=1 FL=1